MNPFDKALFLAQVLILAMWEALAYAFGWNGWAVLAFWFVGLWTMNTLVATGVRTYYKLRTPSADLPPIDAVDSVEITEDDIG